MSSRERSALIIITCCVLHNIALRKGVALDIDEEAVNDQIRTNNALRSAVTREHQEPANANAPYLEGLRFRRAIVDDFFADD